MTPKIGVEEHEHILELFQGEVLAEALFDAMIHHCKDDRERYVLGTMLQLETETKARLRQAVAERAMPFAEDTSKRDIGRGLAKKLENATWTAKMHTLFNILNDVYVPRYHEINEAAGAQDKKITEYMVLHETSLREALRREMNGQKESSVETILPQLRYPLPAPHEKET